MLHTCHNCRSGVFKKCLYGVSRGSGGAKRLEGLLSYARAVRVEFKASVIPDFIFYFVDLH